MLSMIKKHDKDLWFVINAFAVALMVLAVMFTIKPYLEPPDPLKPQIMDYAAGIPVIPAGKVGTSIAPAQGKPVMVVVFASWCGYCRMMMPDIAALAREGRLDGVRTVLLSRDRSRMDLATYMVHSGYYRLPVPYIVEEKSASLKEALQTSGSHFSNAIPYVIFYDRNGRLAGEIPGIARRQNILDALARL